MSTSEILLLGAIAGGTIFLGLPIGRMQLGPNARSGLSALATGIPVFLLWDVLSGAVDPIDTSLQAHHWGRFAELSALGAQLGEPPPVMRLQRRVDRVDGAREHIPEEEDGDAGRERREPRARVRA